MKKFEGIRFSHFAHLSVVFIASHSLTIRPLARKGYGSIAHEAKPNGLLTRGP